MTPFNVNTPNPYNIINMHLVLPVETKQRHTAKYKMFECI